MYFIFLSRIWLSLNAGISFIPLYSTHMTNSPLRTSGLSWAYSFNEKLSLFSNFFVISFKTVTLQDGSKSNRVSISLQLILASDNEPGTNSDMRITGFPFGFADSEQCFAATLHANHKVTPQLFMNGNRYLYYQNPTEGGNNQNPIGLGLDAVSVLGLSFQYRTTA